MSRRAAEKEIENGFFEINGEKAHLGARVKPDSDAVTYKGRPINPKTGKRVYIILNKPKGYVTTMSDEKGRKTVAELVDAKTRVYPVGRLDINSEGLLLMTDDGELANEIMHPSNMVQKIYRVTVRGNIENTTLDRLRAVKEIGGEKIAPFGLRLISRSDISSVIEFTLHEGKNREVRRICETENLFIKKLVRTALGPLRLGNMKTGEYRSLTREELISLRKTAESGGNKNGYGKKR